MNYITISDEEILNRWKITHGWEPLNATAKLANPQLDAYLMQIISQWYTSLLCTLPPHELPLDEFSGSAVLNRSPAGFITLPLPPRCLRPVSVRLSCWSATATVQPETPWLKLRQHNPFTAATAEAPLALSTPDSSITLYPALPDAALFSFLGVPLPDNNNYRLTPAMLAKMADNDLIYKLKNADRL